MLFLPPMLSLQELYEVWVGGGGKSPLTPERLTQFMVVGGIFPE